MKLKRWLSRALVLAMVVALMIPVPVAAKGGGGKLVKSVKVYSMRNSGRWQAESQVNYKYDKKGYPVEIANTDYTQWFLGVPVGGSKSVSTVKYKYKGKTPKSAKIKDGSGNVTQVRKYKKGRVVSIANTRLSSTEAYDYSGDTPVFKGDNVRSSAWTETVSYNKYGLVTGTVSTSNQASTPVVGTASTSQETSVLTYALTQKKGVPSLLIRDASSSGSSASGTETHSWQENADGTYTYVDNGVVDTGKSDYIYKSYAVFDGKGLVIEDGVYEYNTKTGIQIPYPSHRYTYASKKGKVTQAIVYDLETNAQGVVTKTTATTMYEFKYAKTKAAKVRYLSMINSFVNEGAGFFPWF